MNGDVEMSNEKKELISLSELDQLTHRCLTIMSLMDRLAGCVQNGAPEDDDPGKDNDMQHAARMARELMGSVRKIKLASLMYERTLICVSGMQGAGKTTLMKHFYGLDDDCLNISLERGEEIPVFITEKDDMPADKKPELYAIQIMKDEKGEYHQQELEMSPEEFRNASKGKDAATMYLELRVPYKHTKNEKTSFVLLPGFEARKSYRETLVDFAISSSNAAIFAFDGRLLSQQDNYRHLKELAEKFGAHIIYAITRSDSAVDGNAAVRETFMQEMKIKNENQVVCTGAYAEPKMNEEWIRQLANAINLYGYPSIRSQENNIDYLKDEIDVIRGKLSEIEEILETTDDGDIVSHTNDKLLRQFDEALANQVKQYQTKLKEEYGKGAEKSRAMLSPKFDARNGKLHSLRKAILGVSKADMEAAEQIVKDSLYENEEGYTCKRVLVPERCRMEALKKSLRTLEDPQNASLPKLLSIDEDAHGQRYLTDNKQNLEVPQSLYSLIQKPSGKNEPSFVPENVSSRQLMASLVEIGTYYYSMSCYDAMAKDIGAEEYKPCEDQISWEEVEQSAKRASDFVLGVGAAAARLHDAGRTSKEAGGEITEEQRKTSEMLCDNYQQSSSVQKFSVGLVGMTGMDLIGDAKLNLIPQIASSFGVSIGVVATVAGGALAAGAAIAIGRDITRIQCDDYGRARVALDTIYDKLEEDAIEDYKAKMAMIRGRLEENLIDTDSSSRKTQQIYNVKKQINAARDLLDELADRCTEKLEENFL